MEPVKISKVSFKHLLFFLFSFSVSLSFAQKIESFKELPSEPDYNKISFWAAHPEISDASDIRYKSGNRRDKKNRRKYGELKRSVPTFFVHPTVYFQGETWNADALSGSYRNDIDLPLAFQAAVFNDVGPVWAPHYRQMMYDGYFVTSRKDSAEARKAYDIAYSDVLRAFKLFLDKNPEGSFILAGHSQGTGHLKRLIKENIIGVKDLQSRVLAAYLLGHWVGNQEMVDFPICDSPEDSQCWMSWRSCGRKFNADPFGDYIGVVNPLTWSLNDDSAKRNLHKGAMYPNGKKILVKGLSAQIDKGILRIQNLRGPLGWFFIWDDYHRADYNLFWFNIRENIYRRLIKSQALD